MSLGMLHHRAKFLSTCETVKLEKKVITSKMQWWDKHGVKFIDFPTAKGRKESLVLLCNFKLQQVKFH